MKSTDVPSTAILCVDPGSGRRFYIWNVKTRFRCYEYIAPEDKLIQLAAWHQLPSDEVRILLQEAQKVLLPRNPAPDPWASNQFRTVSLESCAYCTGLAD
jgi:hypothetical protein